MSSVVGNIVTAEVVDAEVIEIELLAKDLVENRKYDEVFSGAVAN